MKNVIYNFFLICLEWLTVSQTPVYYKSSISYGHHLHFRRIMWATLTSFLLATHFYFIARSPSILWATQWRSEGVRVVRTAPGGTCPKGGIFGF